MAAGARISSEQEVANTVVGLDIAVAAVGMPSGWQQELTQLGDCRAKGMHN